jgi:hypothetical protein
MSLSYNPTVANDGLVLYLDAFNSSSYAGTGNTAFDLISGKSYTLVSSPTFDSTGPKCFNLNGSTHYLSGNINQLNFGTGDFTIQTNFKLNGLSNGFTGAYNAAFVCAAAGSTGSCLIQVGGGSTSYTNIGIYHETTGILSSINYNFSTNIIYNVALARSSGVLTAYVNGTAIGSTTTTNLYDFNKGGNFIGRHYFGGYEQYFKGNVYSLQAYSRGLSSTEILQNYNATKKRFLPEENIVTGGLVFNIDASKSNSYAGVGNTIYDISGSGKIGTLTNGPTFSGLNGGSIAFDGSNDYILFPNSDVMGSVYTQNIWFKKNSSNVGDLADAQYSGALVYSGSIVFYYTNVPPYTLTAYYSFAIGVWYCLSLVRGSSVKQIYLNGNILASTGSTDMYDAPGTNFVIGSNGGNSEFLNGNIAQVQVYSRALSSTEILQNYNALKTRYGLS